MEKKIQRVKRGRRVRNHIIDYSMILVGSAVYALAVNIFVAPNNIAPGGLTGIAVVLHYLFPFLPIGASIIVMNIPLFIWGTIENGKRFFLKSAVGTVAVSLAVDLSAPFMASFEYKGDKMLAAIFSGVLIGVGLALIIIRGGSTGGAELVSKIIHKRRPYWSIGTIMLVIDVVVLALAAGAFRSIESALYAGVAIFVSSKIIDSLIYGVAPDNGKLMFIITEKPAEIASAITQNFTRGVTIIDAKGGFREDPKGVILCAAWSNQVYKISNLIKELDENSFIIITTAGSIKGNGFEKIE